MVRIKAILTLVLIALFIITPFNLTLRVRAGNVDNPEIVDIEGDSVSGKTSQDLLWAYIGFETNTTFSLVMGMKSLDTFTDPSQIANLPTTTYEFYFTIKGTNYGAYAQVPVHGPFGIDIKWELVTVEYNGTTPSKETNKASITTARYDYTHGIINMTIKKSDVNGGDKGDKATNLWCAVYSKQRSSGINMTVPVLQDRAPDQGYGTEYTFIGNPEEVIVAIELSTTSALTANITATSRLRLDLSVFNNGTNTEQVNMSNSTATPKFSVSWSPATMTVEPGHSQNISLFVNIKDLRLTKDGDVLTLQVWGETNIGNATNPAIKPSNQITFRITAQLPAPPPTKTTTSILEQILKFFRDNKNALLGLLVVLIILVIGVVVYSKLKSGKKEYFEDIEVSVKHPSEDEG
jgi:hypothetical protein